MQTSRARFAFKSAVTMAWRRQNKKRSARPERGLLQPVLRTCPGRPGRC